MKAVGDCLHEVVFLLFTPEKQYIPMRLSLRAVFVEETASQTLKGERLFEDFPPFLCETMCDGKKGAHLSSLGSLDPGKRASITVLN
jgi:hypothetical protein